jgi:hypothetical protein
MKTLKFVWIDDQKPKVESYRAAIEAGLAPLKLKASIELIEVKKELLQTLANWTAAHDGKPPNLFIIDHVFNTALPFDLNGSSVAHLLRNEFPAVPMVCVTAKLDSPNTFDQEDLSEYTALFLYTRLEDHVEDLFVIAIDFRKLTVKAGNNVRSHLVDCLKAPARDRDDLIRVLPEEFQNQKHATTEHRMARWIYAQLLPRPGFLYNRLHAATLLGLTEAGFKKVEKQFEKALYKGVFAVSTRPHWWVSELRRLLFLQGDANGPDVPQMAGRSLPGITEADHSVCYVTKKTLPPPDTVVFADATRDASYRVVQRQYAKEHPNEAGASPGFESRLVLAPKK